MLAQSPAAMESPEADALSAGGGHIWAGLARGVAVGGAFLIADRAVREAADASQSRAADAVASRAKWIGTWRSSAPYLLAGTLAASLAVEGGDGLATSAAIVAGALAGSAANEVVNVPIGRHRPREERGSLAFNPLRGHTSFPSGHAAFTFALAGAIDEVTEGSLPGILAYGAAAMTGLSRIYHDSHWFSDVAVGAVVGATVSRTTARTVRARLAPERDPSAERIREGRDGGGTVGHPGPPSLTAGPGWIGVEVRF